MYDWQTLLFYSLVNLAICMRGNFFMLLLSSADCFRVKYVPHLDLANPLKGNVFNEFTQSMLVRSWLKH